MKKQLFLHISKREWASFMLTLIATLVGVILAIWLTNLDNKNKEKEDTVKLLKTAKIILLNTHLYSHALYKEAVKYEKDSTNSGKESLKILKDKNPIPYPDLLETIISNELVSKNVSKHSHNYIYSGLISLRRLSNYQAPGVYLNFLENMMLHLDLEIQRLEGEINIDEIQAKFELEKKKIKNDPSIKEVEIEYKKILNTLQE